MGNPRQITQIQQFYTKSIGAKTTVVYPDRIWKSRIENPIFVFNRLHFFFLQDWIWVPLKIMGSFGQRISPKSPKSAKISIERESFLLV